jgi:hypothetical protein
MMTAQTFSPAAPAPSLARRLLLCDALASATTGSAARVGARPLADFLGVGEGLPLALTGGGLVAYAALLYWRTRQEPLAAGLLRAAIVVNTIWVVASALLVIENPFALTGGGRWLVGIVAALVADLTIAQVYALRRLR